MWRKCETTNNLTHEQLKSEAESIINSDRFNKAVNDVTESKMWYYGWLKNYLHYDDFKLPFTSKEHEFNYMIDYIYRCMTMDGVIKENENTSLVYFIRNKYNGLLKIGKTDNLGRRISEIKNCFNFLGLECHNLSLEAIAYCPFGVNNSKVETYYHNIFSNRRKLGEWFDISYEDLIESLNIDYVINNVLISIEDIGDFPYGAKDIKIIEEDEDNLKNKISKEMSDKIYSDFCVFNNNTFSFLKNLQKNKSINLSSKDIYDYVISLDSVDEISLEQKIINTLTDILNNANI